MQNTEGDTKPNIPRRPSSKGFGNKVFSDVPVHSVWRLLSLLLLILCLIQLIGLVGFGIRYSFLFRGICRSCFKQKEFLLSQNSKLSADLREVTTKFCRKLMENKTDHPCKPCPEHWYWHGNNCYKIMMENLTWSESREACAFQNSSLVKIDNKEEWYFVTAKIERYHWVGLSRNARDLPLKWEDGSEVNSEVLLLLSDGKTEGKLCAVVYRNDLNLDICKKMYPFICERAADPVKKELLT
ncbi:C-type lectin domain family 1 member B-like isoform X1 [Ornithorhynchus anatinus]|uniref:C-type lectin domain-containing protein n=1 Tax=Ornithorhynchus anatinus TaxID=9258 RepID=F6XST0_ORNAN|nr:C-type lectin domain family 1 member B-like isoform X1 [Ornithorhynchus anatinus]